MKNKNQKTLLCITIFIFVFLTAIISYRVVSESSLNDLYFSLLSLNLAIFIPLIFFILRKDFDLFEPIYIYSYFYALLYLFTTCYIYDNDLSKLFVNLNFDLNDRINIEVIYILTFGILFFYIGYYLAFQVFKKKKVSTINIQKNKKYFKYFKYFLLFYIVSILFRFYGYSSGFMGSTIGRTGATLPTIPFISMLFFISNIWPFYFGYFSLLSHSSKKFFKLFILFLIVEIFFMLVSGDRRAIIVIMLIYFASLWYVKHVFPWKKVFLFFVLVLFIFLPITTVFGYHLANNPNISLKLSNTIGYLFDAFAYFFQSGNENSIFNYVLFPIAQSFNGLYNVSIAYKQFYLNGISLGPIGLINFFGLILPTFLYPEKHEYARNYLNVFGDHAFNYHVDYSYLNILFPSEMIMSYGIIGVLAGMFILGFIMNFLYKQLNSYSSIPIFRIFYISYIGMFSYGLNSSWIGSDIITTYRLLLYFMIIYIFYQFRLTSSKNNSGVLYKTRAPLL